MKSFSWPLLRDAGRLLLLQNQPLPTVGKRLRCRGVDSAWRLQRTDLECVPVTTAHAALLPVRQAWARLSHATHDAETLAALLLILCASSSSGARCAAPLPGLRRTDVRPWLSDAAAINSLLRTLMDHLPQALRLLSIHRWLPLDQLSGRCMAEKDWFILTHCGEHVRALDAEATTCLSRELLALAPPGRRWLDASMAAKAIDSLHLTGADDGMGLAMRVWTLSGSAWLREVAAMEPGDHATVLRVLVATNAAAKAPPPDVRRVFATLNHVGDRERRDKDLRWIIKALKRGTSASYLASALRIAKLSQGGDVTKLDEAPQIPWPMPLHLFLWLSREICSYCLKRAWKACAKVPGLVDVLKQVRTVQWLPSGDMDLLVTLLVRLADRKPKQPILAISDLLRLTTVIISTIRRLGIKQASSWINAFDDFISPSGAFTAAGCEQAIALTNRLHKLAGHDATDIARVLRTMIDVKGEELLTLTTKLHDTWCKRIGEASATWVRRDRARDGIRRLDRRAFDLLWPACRIFPLRWFNLMQEIACVPEKRVSAIFDCAAEHPLFACQLRQDEPRAALIMIDAVRTERCTTNPVSPRLREHVAGLRNLPPHLLKHDMTLLTQAWLEAQLHLVNELVQAEVWRSFPGLKPASGITDHSLKLALTADYNKRPLRRLIRHCASGEQDWTAQHPINQRWQRLLGDDRATRWRDGIATARVLANLGEVIIAPEDDPQEVLRMGTAVGSCLSLGAFNSYSVASNALDANKRVVFARTGDGKVVGRQLLAISDENRLVCFSPYPAGLKEPLMEFFEDYDQVLASHLGLPLHRAGDYTITTLVAKEWYDDGLWSRMARAA